MLNRLYKSIGLIAACESVSSNACIENLTFNDQGLISVVMLYCQRNDVLMYAWMNRMAIVNTLATERMIYWSRSRRALRMKGKSSCYSQQLVTMRFDCDGDILLFLIKQTGPDCHADRPNCFYLEVNIDSQVLRLHIPAQRAGNTA